MVTHRRPITANPREQARSKSGPPTLHASGVTTALALQRHAGNRSVVSLLAVQRGGTLGNKGLVALAPGIEGEVGIPGSLDKGASLFPPTRLKDSSVAAMNIPQHGTKLLSKTNANIHDIGESKWLWAQIPTMQLLAPKAEIKKSAEAEAIEERKKSNNNNAPAVAAVSGLVLKSDANRGGVRHRAVRDALFPHDPSVKDIEQGALGDCYLLAALASVVATRPDKIRSMIKDNGDGTVTVTFHKVDRGQGGQRVFAGTSAVTVQKSLASGRMSRLYADGKAIWPALIEKAYAAWENHNPEALPEGFKRTYEGIASGTSDIPYEQILGVPAKTKNIRKMPKEERYTTPWSTKVYQAGNRNITLQPDDTLDSIASGLSMSTPDLRKALREYYSKDDLKRFGGPAYVEFYESIGDSDKILGVTGFVASDGKPFGPPVVINIAGPSADDECARLMPDMPKGDRALWVAHIQTEGWKDVAAASQRISEDAKAAETKTGVYTLDFIEKHARSVGLSEKGVAALVKYCTGYLEGSPAKPETYSKAAVKLFTDIRSALQQGMFVSVGSQKWGTGEGNAGENIEDVEGIVSGHAFSVIDTIPSYNDTKAKIDGQPLFLRLRNPWGRFGREYKKDFTPKKTEKAEFNLEITDARKYFNQIYITKAALNDVSSDSGDQAPNQ